MLRAQSGQQAGVDTSAPGCRVYVSRPLPEPGIHLLREGGAEVLQNQYDTAPSEEEWRAGLAQADGLLCVLGDRIDEARMAAAPRLQVIANLAVGYDNIDLAAARSRGITVTNTPDVLTDATADLAWALLLALARRLREGERLLRSGSWKGWSPIQLLGTGLQGKTLGIFGFGRIGQAVARRAAGFGMSVIYCSRSPKSVPGLAAEPVGLEGLLAGSDVLSLHSPLIEETRHRFGAAELSALKPGCLLINTSRGALIDEAALTRALQAGELAGAGLDVYEFEPKVSEALLAMDQVVLLPHLGSATKEARAEMVRICSQNLLRVLRGEPALTPVG